MRFSQRVGLRPAIKLAQREGMDDELRASMWRLLSLYYWDKFKPPGHEGYGQTDYVKRSNLSGLIVSLWLHYFKKPIDTIDTLNKNSLFVYQNYIYNALQN